jgi:hypothetical protein
MVQIGSKWERAKNKKACKIEVLHALVHFGNDT